MPTAIRLPITPAASRSGAARQARADPRARQTRGSGGQRPGVASHPPPAQPALAPTSCSQPPRVPPTVAGTIGLRKSRPRSPAAGGGRTLAKATSRAPAPGSITGCPCRPPIASPSSTTPRRRWCQRRADGRPARRPPQLCPEGAAPTWHKPEVQPLLQPIARAKLIAKIFAKLIARTMSSWRRSVYKLFQGSRRNSPCKGALWLQAWLARGPGKTRAPK